MIHAEGELPVSLAKLLSSLGLAALSSLLPVGPAAAQQVVFIQDLGAACTNAFGSAGGIAVDPHSGNVVVTAPETSAVCILAPDGTVIGLLTLSDGVTPFPFLTPLGVAIDPDSGAIIVADAGAPDSPNSGSVTVFSAAGVQSATQLTMSGQDLFDTPTGVAIDASLTPTRGQIAVADPSLNIDFPALRVFNAINLGDASATANGGTPGSEQIENFNVDEPLSIATDSAGNVWVGDVEDQAVYEVSPLLTNQAFLTIASEPGVVFIPFPLALSFDPVFGNLAVVSFIDVDAPFVVILSTPGPVFMATPGVVRRNITRSAAGALAAHPAQHPAARRTTRSRFAALATAAARRRPKGARPECGCEVNLVNTSLLTITNGAAYESFSSFGSTQGGQSFFADVEEFPVLVALAYIRENTLLVGDESGGPLQEFNLSGVDVPTLGGIAALGFAGLLGTAALFRLRRTG